VAKLRVEVKEVCGESERKEIKENEKVKEMHMGIFSLNSKNNNIERTGSRGQDEDTGNISENTEIVPKSSISERLANYTKNQ